MSSKQKKFKVLDHTVYISTAEIFETFVAFDDDLIMGNESYSKYNKVHHRLIDFFNNFISLFSQYC